LTGNTDYEAIFNIGESDEYHLLDIIAPDVAGTRTLLDSKGRVPRIVDVSGGSAANIGVVQEDQMQEITGSISQAGSTGFQGSGSVRS
jgi:hypothetical protein